MSKSLSFMFTSVVVGFTSIPAFAMEDTYEEKTYKRFNIIGEIKDSARTRMYNSVKTAPAQKALDTATPQGTKVTIQRKTHKPEHLHISLASFNYDYPDNEALHRRFGNSEQNYFFRVMARFAGSNFRTDKACYPLKSSRLDLWCIGEERNVHFSMESDPSDGIEAIESLPQVLRNDRIKYAVFVLRLSAISLEADWKTIVQEKIIPDQDQEASRPMGPYQLQNALKAHVTMGRVVKTEMENGKTKTIPFSGEADLDLLKSAYENVLAVSDPVHSFSLQTLRLVTQDKKHNMVFLGDPQQLEKIQ